MITQRLLASGSKEYHTGDIYLDYASARSYKTTYCTLSTVSGTNIRTVMSLNQSSSSSSVQTLTMKLVINKECFLSYMDDKDYYFGVDNGGSSLPPAGGYMRRIYVTAGDIFYGSNSDSGNTSTLIKIIPYKSGSEIVALDFVNVCNNMPGTDPYPSSSVDINDYLRFGTITYNSATYNTFECLQPCLCFICARSSVYSPSYPVSFGYDSRDVTTGIPSLIKSGTVSSIAPPPLLFLVPGQKFMADKPANTVFECVVPYKANSPIIAVDYSNPMKFSVAVSNGYIKINSSTAHSYNSDIGGTYTSYDITVLKDCFIGYKISMMYLYRLWYSSWPMYSALKNVILRAGDTFTFYGIDGGSNYGGSALEGSSIIYPLL